MGEISNLTERIAELESQISSPNGRYNELRTNLADVATAVASLEDAIDTILASASRQSVQPSSAEDSQFRMRSRLVVEGLVEKIEDSKDEATLSKLQALGPIYADILPVQKAIQDLRTHGPRYVAMSEVFDALDLSEKQKVMEVGCNTGFLSFMLKDRHPELDVLAIDKSAKQIQMDDLLKTLLGINVSFVVAEGDLVEHAPAASIDVVFLCELLEHFEYDSDAQHAILGDSLAVCSPKGQLVVTVPYEDRIPAPGHLTEFTGPMLRALLMEHCSEIEWLESARHAYGLEKHFIVTARP
jgi:2-polyprenyl-3-methyl-5-hydroxy-6-metoxy-1,4-benzoquinol methylase